MIRKQEAYTAMHVDGGEASGRCTWEERMRSTSFEPNRKKMGSTKKSRRGPPQRNGEQADRFLELRMLSPEWIAFPFSALIM
jgi:hypothetical protein